MKQGKAVGFVKVYTGTNPGFLAVNLQEDSSYEFLVRTYTKSVGTPAVSPATRGTTPKNAPEGWSKPTIIKVGQRLVALKWAVPTKPNGKIVKYSVLLNKQIRSRASSAGPTVTIENLVPFTQYLAVIQGCTNEGCSTSPGVFFTTSPDKPENMPGAKLAATSATSIRVSWSPPQFPNGKMTKYSIVRTHVSTKEVATKVVDGNTQSFEDSELLPFADYSYQITAFNAVGNTVGASSDAKTLQGTPVGMQAPGVKSIDGYTVRVSLKPAKLENGVLKHYQVFARPASKDTSNLGKGTLVHTGTATEVDIQNEAIIIPAADLIFRAVYTNGVGAAESGWVKVTTLDAKPDAFDRDVAVVDMSETTAKVTWTFGSRSNGKIVKGTVNVDNKPVYNISSSHMDTSQLVRKLVPNQLTNFSVTLCTSVGCRQSKPVSAKTKKSVPGESKKPVLKILDAKKIQVIWELPPSPNQDIINTELYRDGKLIFKGKTPTSHIDDTVKPVTEYSYVVKSYNDVGGSTSPTVTGTTPEDVPENLVAPTGKVLSATSIEVTWKPPVDSHGKLTEYRIVLHTDIIVCRSPNALTCKVSGLSPYTPYSFRLQACNAAGCGLSEASKATLTGEAAPEDMAAPELAALSGSEILSKWEEPAAPNGKILYYELWVQGAFTDKFLAGNRPTEFPGQTTRITTTAASELAYFDLLKTSNHDGSIKADGQGTYSFDGNSGLTLKEHPEKLDKSFSIVLDIVATPRKSGYVFVKADKSNVPIMYALYMTATSGRLYFFYRSNGRLGSVLFRVTVNDGKQHKLVVSVRARHCAPVFPIF